MPVAHLTFGLLTSGLSACRATAVHCLVLIAQVIFLLQYGHTDRNTQARASLFRRFLDTNVYVPLNYGKLATKYPWIYGYFYSVGYVEKPISLVTCSG